MTLESDAATALLVDGVSKTFTLPREKVHTLKERALHPFRRTTNDRLEALQDVSFDVRAGEFFGIVGRNGSGKSTLLKCMAGIYGVDQGRIYIDGRLSTFIELGVGFNADLAARDNVMLNGVMLGLSPREARRRYDQVIEFAELEEFQDLKLKNYSSGMQVRLAFSVMIQVDADVLLIDEVLAVGDAAFQQKCFDVFHRLRDAGKTIIFVTHDMASVKRFCDRAMLLERGHVRLIDAPERVADHYVELNFGRDHLAGGAEGVDADRYGDGAGELVEAWFEDEHGERIDAVMQGHRCTFRSRVVFHRRVEHPAVAVVIEDEERHPLLATSTDWADKRTGSFGEGDEVTFSVTFDANFAPGRLHASPWVAHRGGANIMDRRPRLTSLLVAGTLRSGALVDLPHEVTFEHGDVRRTGLAGVTAA